MRKMTWAMAVMATAMLLPATPVWAIFKCLGPDGKVTFQDASCPGQGEEIEVKLPTGPAVPASAPAKRAPAPAPAAKKEGVFGERWQRRTALETSGVANAQADLEEQRAQCARERAALTERQTLAEQRRTVAGRLQAQEVAQEMEEAEEACNARIKALEAELRKLEEELNGLQQKP